MSAPALDLAAIAHRRRDVRALMGEVMLALLPGTLLHAWLIGPGVLVNVAIAVLAALALEALALRARARPVRPALADGSVALAAWLLALALPPALPVGQLLVGVAAAVLLGKHLYGGLGGNPFNPAMVGYAVLIVSFPVTMTAWPASAAGAAFAPPAAFVAAGEGWDAMTAATPLDRLRTVERLRDRGAPGSDADDDGGDTGGDFSDESALDARTDLVAIDPGRVVLDSPWPWVNGGFLVGGLWLLARGVVGWRIPVSMLATLALLHAVHGAVAAVPQPPVHAELLAGAAVLGAFFIATDPVSAASGPRARLVYGAGIGALTFVLREFGAYPEGVAFAVLLMNACVPLLDRLSVPAGGRP